MNTYRIKYQMNRATVQAPTAVDAAMIAMRRWVTRSQYARVNGVSLNADGTGCYQTYVPAQEGDGSTSRGGTIKVIGSF